MLQSDFNKDCSALLVSNGGVIIVTHGIAENDNLCELQLSAVDDAHPDFPHASAGN